MPDTRKDNSFLGINGTVLLTGATGFLGSRVLAKLLEAGYRVIVLKRSFSRTERIQPLLSSVRAYDIDRTDCDSIFSENAIDTVIHCATNYGRRKENPLQVIEANLMLPLGLLYAGQQHGLKSFINTDTVLDKRINYYSLSKSHFADWLRMMSPQMKCVTLSLEHFYGPGDDRTKFVTSIIRQLLEGVKSIDLTKGEQKRDFIHVDDVVGAFIKVVDNIGTMSPGYHKMEVGSGGTITIRDFVEKLKAMTGNTTTELKFGALPYRENEVMESHVDISGISRLGWRPMTGLEEGLKSTIEQERGN